MYDHSIQFFLQYILDSFSRGPSIHERVEVVLVDKLADLVNPVTYQGWWADNDGRQGCAVLPGVCLKSFTDVGADMQ